MAGPTLSRFLGLFRLRDASDPAHLAAVSAAGAVKGEGAGVAGAPAGGVMTVQGTAGMRPLDTSPIDPTTGNPYDPTISAPVVLPKSATITPSQTLVTTTRTLLFNVNVSAADRLIRCITADIFIGGPTVTAANGYLIKAGEPGIRFPASVGEIHGITASGSATAYTLEQ